MTAVPRPGPRRPIVNMKLAQSGIDHIQKRADEETGGNFSEMARRLLAYAAHRMPKDWTP